MMHSLTHRTSPCFYLSWSWSNALWLNAMHCGKKWWILKFVAPYIFPLNPDYVAARPLRSLRSKYNPWLKTIDLAPRPSKICETPLDCVSKAIHSFILKAKVYTAWRDKVKVSSFDSFRNCVLNRGLLNRVWFFKLCLIFCHRTNEFTVVEHI